MNDIRRTILWVIFGFSMVLLWDQWQVHNGQKPTFFPSSSQTAKAPVSSPAPIGSATASGAEIPAPVTTTGPYVPSMTSIPSTELPAVGTKKEQFEVSNDVLRLTFDTEGGTLVRSEFANYADMTDKRKGFVLL